MFIVALFTVAQIWNIWSGKDSLPVSPPLFTLVPDGLANVISQESEKQK